MSEPEQKQAETFAQVVTFDVLDMFYRLTIKDTSPEELDRVNQAWIDTKQELTWIKPVLEEIELWPFFSVLMEIQTKQPPTEPSFLRILEKWSPETYQIWLNRDADEMFAKTPMHETLISLKSWVEYRSFGKVLSECKKAFNQSGEGAAMDVMYLRSIRSTSDKTEELDISDPIIMDKSVIELNRLIKDNVEGRLNMHTGLECWDKVSPIQVGNFVAVLGSSGGYKSTTLRTIGYQMSKDGYKTLYCPLEMGNSIEHLLFEAQHVVRNKPDTTLNRKDIREGTIGIDSQAYLDFLWGVDDLKRLSAEGKMVLPTFVNFTSRSTWPNIMRTCYHHANLIEQQGSKLSALLIDYITLISKGGSNNPREFMEDVLIDLARYTTETGIAIITPIQTHRQIEITIKSPIAKSCIWTTDDIYSYSEVDKSTDLILSVYAGPYVSDVQKYDKDGEAIIDKNGEPVMTQGLAEQELNELRLGTAKVRFGPKIEHFEQCTINHKGGFLENGYLDQFEREKQVWQTEVDSLKDVL